MRVVQWSAPKRIIDQTEANDFYDRPLVEPWLFHFTTRDLRLDPHEGPFSLKLVRRGEERYRFGSRQVCLRPGQLLFSGADRTYSSEISSLSECISLFLPPAVAAEVWSESTSGHDAIICGIRRRADWPIPVTFAASKSVRDLVPELLSALGHSESADNLALELVSEAAQQWRRVSPVRDLTGPRRAATREELIGRVIRARAMIDDLYGANCELDSLAEEACLSKFHFLRVFKEAFGLTPGQYAGRVRVKRAAELEVFGKSGTAAARAAGYARPSSLKRARSKVLS
jgi:AraC family transcriptional regulator